MKKIANLIFKIHLSLFKYPCKSHARLALQRTYVYDLEWNIGMLYVCGDDIKSISDWFNIDEKEIKLHLCNLVEGVVCE
jgi:hypothetical protein